MKNTEASSGTREEAGPARRPFSAVFILIATLNLVAVLLSLYLLDHSRTSAESQAKSTTSSIAEAVASSVEAAFEKSRVGVWVIAREVEDDLERGKLHEGEIEELIEKTLIELPHLDAIRVTDENGEVIYGAPKGVKANASDRDYFKTLKNDPKLHWFASKPLMGRINRKWSVFIASRYEKPGGGFGGVVLGVLPVDNLLKPLSGINLGEGGLVSLRDYGLGLVARSPALPDMDQAIGQTKVSDEFRAIYESGVKHKTYTARTGSDGIERMMSYRRIDPYGYNLVVGIPTAQLMVEHEAQTVAVKILMPVLLAVSLLVLWFDRRSTRRARKFEVELAESERRFRLFFDSIPDGMLVAEVESRRVVMANNAICELLGYSREELTKLTIDELHPTEDGSYALNDFAQQARGEHSAAAGMPFMRRDGTKILLDIVTTPLVIGGVNCLGGTLRDNSAQRAAEEALKEKTEELDRYFNASLDLLCIAGLDGTFRRLNGEWEKALGFTLGELIGKPFLDFVHPEDREATIGATEGLREGRPALNFVNRYMVKGGGYKWIEWRAYPQGDQIFAVARDITKRIHSEEALRKSEEMLRRSQQVARIGHYTLDVASGQWSSSEGLDAIFGIAPDFPKNLEGWADMIHPEDREGMTAYFRDEVVGKGLRFDREYRIIRPSDSAVVYVHGLGDLKLDAEGKPVTMFGTIQDITERKVAENERLEMEKRLQHAQKLESLGLLAGGIAHDFNNLLMAVLGNLDLALLETSEVAPSRDLIEQAIAASRRAADLTRQMLAYSGKGRFIVTRFKISDLVSENAHLLRASIGKNVELVVEEGGREPLVLADPGQVQQVVLNLITNAADAIGDKAGTITLRTGGADYTADEAAKSVVDMGGGEGRYAFVEVKDTGHGMSPETLKRIFEPFFSTKEMGRGLGMAAVYGIVQSHKGLVFISSAPGQGTVMRVAFPALSDGAEEFKGAVSAQGAPAALPGAGQRALLVDDEEIVRGVCKRMLEALGFEVTLASDGDEAIKAYEGANPPFGLVLMDLSMPRKDGVAAAREILANDPEARIVLSSGYDRGEADARFGGLGLKGFIQKPYSLASLRKALN